MDTIGVAQDDLLEVLGATDEASVAAINAPTAITARIYEDTKDSLLTAAAASGQALIVVSNPEHYAIGDTLAVRQDDGSDHVSVILNNNAPPNVDPRTQSLTWNLRDVYGQLKMSNLGDQCPFSR